MRYSLSIKAKEIASKVEFVMFIVHKNISKKRAAACAGTMYTYYMPIIG